MSELGNTEPSSHLDVDRKEQSAHGLRLLAKLIARAYLLNIPDNTGTANDPETKD
jgi:hypothetical protein